ncbi:MAG: hypothetical protein ACI808_002317 [Paraglaciecola sp.]|jgi:hypothetical protein
MLSKVIFKEFIHDLSNKVMILEGYLSLIKMQPASDVQKMISKLDESVASIGVLLENIREDVKQDSPDNGLTSLVYTSKVKDYITGIALESELDKIHKSAAVFNKDNNITGYLLYLDGYFIQYLEGSQENIEKLYLKISLDDRHSGLTLLCHEKITERVFKKWTKLYITDMHKQSQIPDLLKAIVETKQRLLSKTDSLALINLVSLISKKNLSKVHGSGTI